MVNLQVSSVTVPDLEINGERLLADFEALAAIGDTPGGGINRLALSPDDLLARTWFADRIEEAGLTLQDDDAGNVSGVLRCSNPNARTLLIGSHLDTVPDGGRFDGTVGIIAGLECLRRVREAGLDLPVHLEVIDFTDDEGCWRSLFGVRALAGMLAPEDINDQRVDNGPFRAALTRAGVDPRNVFCAGRDMSTLAGYLELHIEQGLRLERAGMDIGVVTGIVGRSTFRMTFRGQAAHSGTTHMDRRRDALRGAAVFIARAHDATREHFGDGIFNCGKVDVEPGAFNVIPNLACLTVECRHVSDQLLSDMETLLLNLARDSAEAHGLTVEIERVGGMAAAAMGPQVIETIEAACSRLGLRYQPLVSYAGHAAQITSRFIPSGMIFIPSVDGISHNPRELSRWDDVLRGANVLLQAVLGCALRA